MMKYCVSFFMFTATLILVSCTALQQPIDNSIHSTTIEIPSESLSTALPEAIQTDSEIISENENPVLQPTTDFVSDALLLQKLPEIIQVMPEFMQYCNNPVYLSENSRVILAVTGDLNDDEIDDIAVIVEFSETDETALGYAEDGFGFGSRHIYVLLSNKDGNHTVSNKNESLILKRWMGGVFGDPLESLAIEDGILSIKHYGGSSSRWGYDMSFSYESNQLVLTSMTQIYHSTHTANGERTIFDFANHKIERYLWINHENEIYFLYGGELPVLTYLFDNTTFDEIVAYGNISFLPYLDYYQFDTFEKPLQLNVSASQALDIIMLEHYPDFKKVYIPWTQENRDNYSKLLSYEVPDYYYQNASGTLAFFKVDIYESDNVKSVAKHCVIFSSSDNGQTEFYYIDDTKIQ